MHCQILVLIDCSEESRRLAAAVAAQFGAHNLCRVTLAANISPSPSPEIRGKKVRHAQEALESIYDILLGSGIMARRRLVLESSDPVTGLRAEIDAAKAAERGYDFIVLGAHHARIEEFDAPCRGSLADQVIRRSPVPVLVLPLGG